MSRSHVVLCVLILSLLQFQACAPVTVTPDVDPELARKEAVRQKKMAVEGKMKSLGRLGDVSSKVLVSGMSLCGDRVRYTIGVSVMSLDTILKDWKETYKDVLGLGERVSVTHVMAESPAELGGLQKGDVILMMNGDKIEPGEKAAANFQTILDREISGGDDVVLWVDRAGTPQYVCITPVRSCDYPVMLTEDTVVNAYANGDAVMVTDGMMDFIETDEELAQIIGHEMGHNVMGHIKKMTGNRMIGAIFDGLIGGLTGVYTSTFADATGRMFSQDFEREADYLGVYFMERAGYDSTDAPMLWRRMGAKFPYAITHATTHPTSAARYVFLGECSKEIKAKRAADEPLVPNLDKEIKAEK